MHGVELVTANIFAPQELLLILLLALVFFGGKKLPEAARGLGQAVREFHRATAEPEPPEERPLPVTALPAPDAAPQEGAGATAPGTPVILLTGTRDATLRAQAQQLGAFAVLPKPFALTPFTDMVAHAVAARPRAAATGGARDPRGVSAA